MNRWLALSALLFAFVAGAEALGAQSGYASVSGDQDACGQGRRLADHFEVAKKLPLTLPDSVRIFHASDVVFSESGRIAVVDQRDYNVKVFDRDGQYLATVSGRGARRGAIGGNHAATFTGDTLLVADGDRQVLMYFSPEGRLLHETAISARPLTGVMVRDNRIVLAGFGPWPPRSEQAPDASVQVLNHTGTRIASLFPPLDYHHRLEGFQTAASPLVAPLPSNDSVFYVTWRYAAEVRQVDLEGSVLRRGRLPQHDHFRDPEPVFDSLAAAGSDSDALSSAGSPIAHIVASADRVSVGYFSPFSNNSRLRYHLLDSALRLIETKLTGLPIRGSRGDTLVAFRPGSKDEQNGFPTLLYYVACSSFNENRDSAGRGRRSSGHHHPKEGS